MDSLEIRLARDVEEEFNRNAPFDQFQASYFMYKRCTNHQFVLTGHYDVVLDRKMDTLYQRRLDDEVRK